MINGFPIAASPSQPQILGALHAANETETATDETDLSFIGILMNVVAGAAPQAADPTGGETQPDGGNATDTAEPSSTEHAVPALGPAGAEAILQSVTGHPAALPAGFFSISATGHSQTPITAGISAAAVQQHWSEQDSSIPVMQELLNLFQPVVEGEQIAVPPPVTGNILTVQEGKPEIQNPSPGVPAVPAVVAAPAVAAASTEQILPDLLTAAMAVSSEARQARDESIPRMKESMRATPTNPVRATGKSALPLPEFRTPADRLADTMRGAVEQSRQTTPGREEKSVPAPVPQTAIRDTTQESVVTLLRAVEKTVPVLMASRETTPLRTSATPPPVPDIESPEPVTAGGEIHPARETSKPVAAGDAAKQSSDQRSPETSPVPADVRPQEEKAAPENFRIDPQAPVTPSKAAAIKDQQPAAPDPVPDKASKAPEVTKMPRHDEPVTPARAGESAQGILQAAQKGAHELQKGAASGTTGVDAPGRENSAAMHATSVIDQIARSLAASVQSGSQEVRLELHPKELGSVTMKVMVEHNGVTAQIDVKDPGVKTVLENNLPQLREAFARERIEVNRVEIVLTSEGTPQESTRHRGGKQHQGRSGEGIEQETGGQESSRSLGYNTMELTM